MAEYGHPPWPQKTPNKLQSSTIARTESVSLSFARVAGHSTCQAAYEAARCAVRRPTGREEATASDCDNAD